MRFILLILIFLSTYTLTYSQVDCFVSDNTPEEAGAPFCGNINSYHPSNPYLIPKIVRVNFHIMQKNDGTGNFQANDPQHIAYLNSIIPYINNMLTNMKEPYYNGIPTGDSWISDYKLQFVLKGVYFHQDNTGWNNDGSQCGSYCFDNYKTNDDSELNIFFAEGISQGVIRGCGQGLNGENSNYIMEGAWYYEYTQNPPGTHGANHLGGRPWSSNPHLLHEIGHCLNLHHSWNGQFPDMYLPQYNSNCHANQTSPAFCTNNVMSYSFEREFLSPMQLEFIHKELTFSWRKKLVANCEETITYPITVTQNENWDYAVSIADALTISNNATVDVSCKFDYVENSNVTINQFCTLNFNTVEITTCNHCSELTFNVSGNLNYNNTPFTLPPNSTLNINSTGVVNINNSDGLCINQGSQINITNGGKLYINGQDYTNIVANGYNNVYDKFIANQPLFGTHYAYNQITTSGTVNTIPGTPTELIAGRKILLSPKFSGYGGFHARIDPLINNCEETPCGTPSMRLDNPNEEKVITQQKNNFEQLPFQINVYPNPNEGVFSLNITTDVLTQILPDNTTYYISIFNTNGTKVYEKQVVNLENKIDVSNLPKGMYYVNVLNNYSEKLGSAFILK